ncbi:outer membrane lipoprotein-sorting protein [Cyclobacterium salsum]|uniref:outer membrane lipoprotein-sorting protein n=1 Tax=Cyclobacterium salsum TaxID=2666329 RepID=UPI001391BAD8|nr:outer membrane lipoprotein-sorting protein [Cyclobacterium salsum]
MLKRLVLFISLAGFSLALKAQDREATEVLAHYFENTGGIENWRKLTTMRMKGLMRMQGMEFTGMITQARPNKKRVEVDIQGQSMIQAYDGEDAWWLFPMHTGPDPQAMPAEMAEGMVNEFEDDFIDYEKKGHTVELLGAIELEGIPTYEIRLTKENGEVVYYYFDKEYYLPVMQKSGVATGPMKGQFVETYLSDYQEVDGMMIPHFTEVKVNGQFVQSITLQEVDLNPEVDDLIFSRPKKD